MRRADRLYLLTRMLNAARGRVVTGPSLAEALEISLRTLYRDIDALRAGGVDIEGERGLGFRMGARMQLPALGITPDELDALVIGMRAVEKAGDPVLARAALTLLDKIAAALPEGERKALEESSLYSPSPPDAPPPGDLALLRTALRNRRKLSFAYTDGQGGQSRRVVHPLALSWLGIAWVLVAWCELRRDHRVFRTDRMQGVELIDEPIPHRPGPGDDRAVAHWR